jgi:hypothetical protein
LFLVFGGAMLVRFAREKQKRMWKVWEKKFGGEDDKNRRIEGVVNAEADCEQEVQSPASEASVTNPKQSEEGSENGEMKKFFRKLFKTRCPRCRSKNVRAVMGNRESDLYYCGNCPNTFARYK